MKATRKALGNCHGTALQQHTLIDHLPVDVD
jgi:hypothetical protein